MRIPESMVAQVMDYVANKGHALPLYSCSVAAGFPSPADDHLEDKLDLNAHLIQHPTATFFVRVSGDSMIEAGIFPDDILVVDRSLEPRHGKIVVAAVEGQLTVKRLHKSGNQVRLMPANPKFSAITIANPDDLMIWGVVTTVLHQV